MRDRMGRLALVGLAAALLLAPVPALAEEDRPWWIASEPGVSLRGGEPPSEDSAPEAGAAARVDPAPTAEAVPDTEAAPAAEPDPGTGEASRPNRYTDLPIRQARIADLPTYAPPDPKRPEASAAGSAAEVFSPEERAQLERRRRGGNRCARWAKQIVRLQDDLERAREREDERWERATEIHLEQRETRFEAQCVPPDTPNETAKMIVAMLIKAARIAMLASGFGAF